MENPKDSNTDLDIEWTKICSHCNPTSKFEDVQNFCSALGSADRCVLITSGGTRVALEKNAVRFIQNFSTGLRGALSAEQFLLRDYSIVFLYSKGSAIPWLHRINLESDSQPEMTEVLETHRKFKSKLLCISYEDLSEYFYLLKRCCQLLNDCCGDLIVYLAAAVSDFYIPMEHMSQHKIQSSNGAVDLHLMPVPKFLGALRTAWCPEAFIVSFKLETDMEILLDKAKQSMRKYGVHLVVANELSSRYSTVHLVGENGVQKIEISSCARDKAIIGKLEELIVNKIVTMSKSFFDSHIN